MAIKGAVAKEQVIKELLTYFGDRAFQYDKDIRVNCMENGEPVQIKIALTAAKVAVEKDGDTALPAAAPASSQVLRADRIDFVDVPAKPVEPTVDEKQNIKNLLASLGL